MREIDPKYVENPHDHGPLRRKKFTRLERPCIARFLTFSCDQRLPLLGTARLRNRFAQHLADARAANLFLLYAWVIMPEHVHLLLKPLNEEDRADRILWKLKRDFAREIIARWRMLHAPILDRLTAPDGSVRFWLRGGGHDRVIYSDEEFYEKANYIDDNPVRRRLVKEQNDWAWSSARARAGMDSMVPLDQRVGRW